MNNFDPDLLPVSLGQQSLVDGPVSHISRSHSSCSADTCRHEAPTVYTQLSYLDSPRSTSSNGFHGSRRKGERLVFCVVEDAFSGVGFESGFALVWMRV